jgi:uncharacterized membrane protein YgcG
MRQLIIIFTLILSFSTAHADVYKTAVDAGVSMATAKILAEKTAQLSAQSVAAFDAALQGLYPQAAEKIAEKMLEGIAKGVDEQRIIRVINSLRERYQTAYEMADGRATLATALAEAMTAGASKEHLERLIEMASNPATAEETTAFYRDLMRFGVSESRSYDAAVNAVRHDAAEIGRMRDELSRGTGHSDAESMADRVTGRTDSSSEGGRGSTGGMSGGSSSSGGGHGGGRR